jgi:lipopolysaccharide transport system permease protein
MIDTDDDKWDLIISSEKNLISFDFMEILHYKDLIKLMIRRDFVSVYKQTIFGPLWFVFHTPDVYIGIYVCIWKYCHSWEQNGIPQPPLLFLWDYAVSFFATTLQKCSDTFCQ